MPENHEVRKVDSKKAPEGLKNREVNAKKGNGADYRSRTGDLLITSQLLYQLS
tara:strand:+ start:2552 stop:2710 length:159 start_codon:yes stop_codon:yes gene_type:complete